MASEKGKKIKPQKTHKWQARKHLKDSEERNLKRSLGILEALADKLELTMEIRELAGILYRDAISQDLSPGRSIHAMVAACVYAAARLRNYDCTLDEISRSAKMKRKTISSYYRLLIGGLNLKVPIPEPEDYLPRIVRTLGISTQTVDKAGEIISQARDANMLAGRDPRGIAAAAIYLASVHTNERITQKAVASAASVTEVTIRNRYKELDELLKLTSNSGNEDNKLMKANESDEIR